MTLHRAMLLAGIGLAAPISAQEPAPAAATAPVAAVTDTGAVEEIIVTAQKRRERLQDVPIAVTVLGGAALDERGGVSIANAQYLVPALTFRQSGTSTNQSLFLRGVGTATFSIAGEPSISTVLDGVVLSRTGEAFTDLVDIERIEVLRGPQGTLFGKNASAGVINIVSRRPGDKLGGFVEGGFFFDNGTEYRVRAALDLPLGDKIRSRLTGFYSNYDGNIINDAPDVDRRVNGFERYGFRGIVELEPLEGVKLTAIGDWRRADDDCCAEVIGSPARNADGTPFQPFLDRAAVALPPLRGDRSRRVRQNLVTQAIEESWGVSLQADIEAGDHTITSITAYRDYDNREIRDGDFLDRPYVGFAQSHDDGPQTGDTFSQELRVTSPGRQFFDYTAGFYYSRAESERTFIRSNIACAASTLPTIGAGLTPCSTAPGASTLTFPVGVANFGSVFRNTALFGQGTLNVASNFRLIGGVRLTLDQVDTFFVRTTPVPGASNPPFDAGVFNNGLGGGVPNGVPYRDKATETNVSGKAGVQYDFSRQVTAYVTYSRGYKGPAFNVFFNLNPNGTPGLDSESADAFEVGVKSTLFDSRLTFNIAGYYAKYRDFQANNPDFVLGQRVTRFTNAGDISTRGFEIDILARLADDLNIGGGVAYTDAKVDSFRLPAGANPADLVPNGTRLAYAPEWKATLTGDYTVRTGGFADLQLGVQSSYQSEQLSLFVGNPIGRDVGTIRAYALVDLSVAAVGRDDRWRVAFQVKNVLNESFAAAIADGGPLSAGNTGSSSFRYLIPREADRYFGVLARVNFGG